MYLTEEPFLFGTLCFLCFIAYICTGIYGYRTTQTDVLPAPLRLPVGKQHGTAISDIQLGDPP